MGTERINHRVKLLSTFFITHTLVLQYLLVGISTCITVALINYTVPLLLNAGSFSKASTPLLFLEDENIFKNRLAWFYCNSEAYHASRILKSVLIFFFKKVFKKDSNEQETSLRTTTCSRSSSFAPAVKPACRPTTTTSTATSNATSTR
jgi:hypothetical protein